MVMNELLTLFLDEDRSRPVRHRNAASIERDLPREPSDFSLIVTFPAKLVPLDGKMNGDD